MAKNQVAQKQDHPYLELKLFLKLQAIFMAGVGHPQVGPPPLGPKPYAPKAIRPYQVGLPPAWNPTFLRTQRPTALWSLPLWSKQYSWQVLGAIKEDHPQLGPQYMSRKQVRPHQAGSPPAGNPTCLKQQTPTFLCPLPTPSLLGEVKTSSSQRCWNRKYPGFQK